MNVNYKVESTSYKENSVYFDKLIQLKSLKFWIEIYRNKTEEETKNLLNKLQNFESFGNSYTYELEIKKINEYKKVLNRFYKEKSDEVFIPEFVDIDLQQYNTLEKIKNFIKNGITIYTNEEEYKEQSKKYLLETFKQEDIISILSKLNETIKLTKENIDLISDLVNINNTTLSFGSLHLTNKKQYEKLNKLIEKITKSPKEYLTKSKEKVEITKEKTEKTETIKVSYSENEYLKYETGKKTFNTLTISMDSKIYTYKVSKYSDFIDLIDNYKGLKNKVSRFPKYQVTTN